MKLVGWVAGMACMPLAWGALNPWPLPPPQDDDPFCVRPADLDNVRLAFAELLALPSTASRLDQGAPIFRMAVRSLRSDPVCRWTADFYFALGEAELPGHMRVALTRVTRTEDRATGKVTWSSADIEHIILALDRSIPLPTVAATRDAAHAIMAVLNDASLLAVAAELLPYFALGNISTPPGASFASGQALPVTLLFVNQTNREDRLAIVVDVRSGSSGAPEIKDVRSPSGGGGR